MENFTVLILFGALIVGFLIGLNVGSSS